MVVDLQVEPLLAALVVVHRRRRVRVLVLVEVRVRVRADPAGPVLVRQAQRDLRLRVGRDLDRRGRVARVAGELRGERRVTGHVDRRGQVALGVDLGLLDELVGLVAAVRVGPQLDGAVLVRGAEVGGELHVRPVPVDLLVVVELERRRGARDLDAPGGACRRVVGVARVRDLVRDLAAGRRGVREAERAAGAEGLGAQRLAAGGLQVRADDLERGALGKGEGGLHRALDGEGLGAGRLGGGGGGEGGGVRAGCGEGADVGAPVVLGEDVELAAVGGPVDRVIAEGVGTVADVARDRRAGGDPGVDEDIVAVARVGRRRGHGAVRRDRDRARVLGRAEGPRHGEAGEPVCDDVAAARDGGEGGAAGGERDRPDPLREFGGGAEHGCGAAHVVEADLAVARDEQCAG
ncbi:hypothetical protein STTU_3617 [Streptomyces sp. Tu6071]|nr:hypothetical protein STTU_3617 [Streptomyces sp. Tu6071]